MRTRMFLLTAATALVFGPALPAAAAPPAPGCGFGDDNHVHMAAPGLDPMELRPGAGTGDENHEHTAPPGQARQMGVDAGDPADSPRRGCPPAPTD
jgi:hypothetical protein